jgi:two-component system, OmpR family, sensor histidine kinase SenX3
VIRRLALPVAAVFLGGLLVLLASLQYRWLGQISEGERARMRTTLEARARDFAADFDREIGRAASTFAPSSTTLAAQWDKWQATAADSRLVRDVLVVDRSTPSLTLQRYDPATRTLVPAKWPEPFRPAVERWAAELERTTAGNTASRVSTRVFLDDLSDVPALVLRAQPDILRFTISPSLSQAVILWLDADVIRRTILPTLARKYFATDDVFDYSVTVTLRRDPKRVWFATDGASAVTAGGPAPAEGDLSVPMFRARIAEVIGTQLRANVLAGNPPVRGPSGVTEQTARQEQGYSVSVMRFEASSSSAPSRTGTVVAVADAAGGWQLRLAHRAGSLDAAVERVRRRNLAISSTILGLLAVSLGFVLVSTRRAQRLAAQQVEFVASVSHELRTPLTVIRSAGENLADGVVESPEQVRRYGALVADEGRKLGGMVEQVMEYAGMQSDQPRWQMAALDIRTVVDEAVAGARRLPEARDADIETRVDDGLPPLQGDRGAITRAIQNLVENALKYGHDDGRERSEGDGGHRAWVGVCVTSFAAPSRRASKGESPTWIRIEVSDRGPGIDAAERRRIFDPFVRGRAAAASRVPGNGLGLSIVRRVAEGHGGRIEVYDTPDGGATFRLTLPAGEKGKQLSD